MADKIVQLVDKNSNNLYPVAGAVIDNAVSTGAISSQAVTNPKIENGAVNGVENDATAIGTAKLALDTVGTPNLRDASVTSDKIDFTTLSGNTDTVEINTPGKWLIVASTSLVNDTTGNYAVYVEWIGKRSYCSGYHDATKNANAYNVTSTNIIDVSNSYSNTIGYDNIVGSLRLVSAHWVAIKIGPAS